jgi:Ni2+-binding GTPase involved in maturation of urease and hydrogenase
MPSPAAAAATEADGQQPMQEDGGDDPRVPVTIITGFLGAGKTTLINHLLTTDHGMKLAIIENEVRI